MKLDFVFKNSGDTIEFEVTDNHELLEFFIDRCNNELKNDFSDHNKISKSVNKKITELLWSIGKSNEILWPMAEHYFKVQENILDYLDQTLLNSLHDSWVKTQQVTVEFEKLLNSSDSEKASIGKLLETEYPNNIIKGQITDVLDKLGYLFPYEEVNQNIHRLENAYHELEFSNADRYNVFDNPFYDSMTSNNNICNFYFGYTYLGRQYYDKFKNFDKDLDFNDHFNYNKLEYTVNISLRNQETIPFSKEFLAWCIKKNVKPIGKQIPFANILNLDDKLFEYRKVLYRNSRDGNTAYLHLH